jgi:hypothetical protein
MQRTPARRSKIADLQPEKLGERLLEWPTSAAPSTAGDESGRESSRRPSSLFPTPPRQAGEGSRSRSELDADPDLIGGERMAAASEPAGDEDHHPPPAQI